MTAQVCDSIVIDGSPCTLCVLPLEVLFKLMPNRPHFKPPHTANWRGYAASWKIEDGRLWLIGLDGQLTTDAGHNRLDRGAEDPAEYLRRITARIESLPESPVGVRQSDLRWSGSEISDENGVVNREQASSITVEELLASNVSPVPASWYTGLLRIPLGKMEAYVHGGFLSGYETDLIIEIEAGAVSQQWIIDNRPGHEGRRRDAEIMEKSILVFKPAFDLADEREYRAAIGKPLETIFLSWKEQREDNDRPHLIRPRLVANFQAEMEDTYRNWAIISSFPVKSVGLGEAIGYFLWVHFARRVSQAELMSQQDQEARAAYDNAVATYEGAKCAIAAICWLRKHIATRDTALGKMTLMDFVAAIPDHAQFREDYGHYADSCDRAQKLLSALKVLSGDDEMIEWAMDQIRSAEHLIAEENFEVLGLADGLVHEFAEEFDGSRPEGSGSTLIAAAHLMASARNQENGGHFECAMKRYETVVGRWGSSAKRSIRQIVNDALEGQIRLLSEIHSSDDERLLESVPGLYDCLIQRFYEDGDKQKAGEAYLEKARYFLNRRSGLAWETFERIVELFSGNAKPELRKIVEEALREKWILLAEADAPECVEVGIAYADHMLANPLDRDVFSAVTEVCDVLKDVERYDSAFSLYSALSKKIGSGAPRELAEKRVSVLMNMAICLECGEKYQEAIRAFTDVLIETENDDVNFAEALVRSGRSFREIDRGAHGLSYFDEVIRRFGGMEGVMEGLVAEALFEKAATHRELGEDGDAIASYDSLIRRYRDDSRNDVKQTIGEALLAKASLLELDGRIDDARRSFDHAIELFGSEADLSLIRIFNQASTERSKLDQ